MTEAVFQPVENETHASEARYAIEQALLSAGSLELWIDDQYVCALSRAASEFSVEWGKLIFSWWDETHSQNWRVMNYALTAGEVRLRATRGWGHALTTVVLRDQTAWQAAQAERNAPLKVKRQSYAEALPLWLTKHFPAARIERVMSGKRRQRHWAIGYVKVRMRIGAENVLAIGVSADEEQTVIDSVVAAGLVWLSESNGVRQSVDRAQRLIFFVPEIRAATILERLTFLTAKHSEARIECFTVNQATGELTPVTIATQPELLSAQSPALQWPQSVELTVPQSDWIERIVSLAPEVIELRAATTRQGSARLLWHGLEFARVQPNGRAEFGIAGLADFERQHLTEMNFAALQELVAELAEQRCAKPTDRRHPLYGLRPEAWLESCLRRDITALNGVIDTALDERFVYSQIPAWQAESRSVLDLLTVTRTGRLAIIEIKESEDGQLPLQGLDYWWRIEQARLRGELAQHGLFPDLELADQSPLLLLVAPRLRFHRSFVGVARCLSPDIEAFRIGINTNWRERIRVYSYDCAQTIKLDYETEETNEEAGE
ncbi:MAG: hypothetical protein HOP19_29020 [Acidobacteria bacterium]|nr:hypothetical protein [Acidobacteriota bacterium]